MHLDNFPHDAIQPLDRSGQISVTDTILIQAPPSLVWEVSTNVEDWPRWMPTVTEATRLTNTPFRSGSRFRLKQPLQKRAIWELDQVKEEIGFSWFSGPTNAEHWAFHNFVAGPGGTRSTLSFLRLPNVSPPLGFIWKAVIAWALRQENRALKLECERQLKLRV